MTDVNEYPLLEGQRLKLLLIFPKRLLCPRTGLGIVEKHSGHPLLIEGFQVLNRGDWGHCRFGNRMLGFNVQSELGRALVSAES